MTQTAAIAHMLGGTKILKQRIQRENQLERIVQEGIPAPAVRALADFTGTTLTALQAVAGIDRSTFARRDRSRTKLKADESDRIVRFARVAALAIDALGREAGLAWLQEPNDALGGRAPFELLKTDVGTRQVEQIIGRIEYGIFS